MKESPQNSELMWQTARAIYRMCELLKEDKDKEFRKAKLKYALELAEKSVRSHFGLPFSD